jgi:hypothetical protein
MSQEEEREKQKEMALDFSLQRVVLTAYSFGKLTDLAGTKR